MAVTTARKKVGVAAIAASIIAATIGLEGGYVNHSADPGGETNMGITAETARRYGYSGPMRTLPRDVAESIYYQRYLEAPGFAPLIPIDAAVTEELFDTAVNMGAVRPSRWFQQALNEICTAKVQADGKVGPATVRAYQTCQQEVGASHLCVTMLTGLDARQSAEYDRLVRVNPRLKVFLRGWKAHRIGNVARTKCDRNAV